MRVKLPRLLDAGMKEKARLHPVAPVEIVLNAEPPSTANLTISKADAAVKIRDWIELYTKDGSAGIYRVTGVEESYDGEQVWITLEHGIVALGDAVIIGEGTFTGSLDGLMEPLLSHQVTKVNGQPLWRIGSTVATKSVRRDYQNPNLLSELIALLGQAGDVMLTFDQSTLPWVVNLVALDEKDLCEGRFGRNLQSLTVSVDDNDLCTRAIIDGTGEVRDADTISQYGVVARVLNISEYATEESAGQYIEQYLEAHKEPNVSIEISVVDMSESTGESIDSFRLGRMCRTCLPDHGVTVKSRIVSIRMPDVYGDAQDVRVSMGKKQPTLTDLLMQEQQETASTSSRVSRGYGSVSKKVEETDIELIRQKEELTDTRYRMAQAGIVIDKDAEFVKAFAYQETADRLDQRVTATESEILVQADQISMRVQKGDVISSINQTAESIVISASKIDLSGYVTASKFSAEIASIDDIFAGRAQATNLHVNNAVTAQTGQFTNISLINYDCEWKSGTFVTGVTFPVYQENVIYYTNWSGEQVSMRVLMPTKTTAGRTSKSSNYHYLGRTIE